MSKIYFTPGPSQLYHTYQGHFLKALKNDVGSISHRSSQFIKIIEDTTESLKELLDLNDDYHIFFINSANEAWDRIIQNLVLESSHHFTNGSFSKKFYDFAMLHQRKSTYTESADGETFNFNSIPEDAELIGITKNETSVGFQFTEEEIIQLRNAHPNKLIALDMVSATPAIKINLRNVDTAYFSVQKAFGMPAGLGVWIVNDRCISKAEEINKSKSIGAYRSILNLKKFSSKYQTPETPNMIGIYVIGKIAQDYLRYGKERIVNDTTYKSTLIKQLDGSLDLKNFVSSVKNQSLTSHVFTTDRAEEIKKYLAQKGMIIGGGYGNYKDKHIRIANFPAHSKESIEMLFDSIKELE